MYRAPKIANKPKFDRIAKLAADTGYRVDFKGTKHVRGWPQASTRPYQLAYDNGQHIASFATLEKLEANLRGRNGC